MTSSPICRRLSYDGIDLDVLASVSTYAVFSVVFAERAPVSAERIGLCLDAALSHCNLEVLSFLFDGGHITADTIKRQCLPFKCIDWSTRYSMQDRRGEKMVQYLIGKGVDFTSYISSLGGRTPIEVLEREGHVRAVTFLRDILWRHDIHVSMADKKITAIAPEDDAADTTSE